MGYPMAGHLARPRATRSPSTTAPPPRPRNGSAEHGGKAAPTPAEAAEGQEIVFCLRRQRRRPARGDLGARRRLRGHGQGRGLRRPHHGLGRSRARAGREGARRSASRFIDAPVSGGQAGAENGVLTVMCGGDADAFARAEPVIMSFARACRLLGPSGAGQLTKMVNQICIAGLVQGLSEGIALRQEGRARRRSRARGDLQGRGAVLADGEPLQDDERGQVRLRLRRRLDAQGPRRSASTRPAATARTCRSPRSSTSSTPTSRRWAASAGTRRACSPAGALSVLLP